MGKRLCPEMEQEAMRLAQKGYSFREIGRQLKCSRHAVTNILIRVPVRPVTSKWNPSAARLSMKEREEIRAGLERGENFTAIAGLIGRTLRARADEAERRFQAELGVTVEPLRSPLGTPGENNAGLLGYLRSIARNN